jgi:uncharacterized protein
MDPSDPIDHKKLAADWALLEHTLMPFGKYGPKFYPPGGLPLVDLPLEYVEWFRAKGFPSGQIGRLLALVWQVKSEGLDALFDPLRKIRGGKVSTRRDTRPRQISFGAGDDEE